MSDKFFNLALAIFAWLAISIIASSLKGVGNNCGKTYPIGFLIYTDFFCEVKPID